MRQSVFAGAVGAVGALQQGAGSEGKDPDQTQEREAALGLLVGGLGIEQAVGLGVGQVEASAIDNLERAHCCEFQIEGIATDVPGQVGADLGQLIEGPAGTSLAVGAGVFVQVLGVGLFLVVGPDLSDRLAAGGVRTEGLAQEAQEGEFGGIEALAAIGFGGVGGEQGGVEAVGQEAFQVMKGLAAQGLSGLLQRGVELAEERSGRKHIYLYKYRY